MADLYDHPLEFYVFGFAADGAFDADACAAHGYNEIQVAAISKALADNPDQVEAAMAKIEEHKAALAAAALSTEEPASTEAELTEG